MSLKEKSKQDKRCERSKRALCEALACELNECSQEKITVSSLVERADLSRKTFYAHYKDVPDFIAQCTGDLLDELHAVLDAVKQTNLDELFCALAQGEPYPGAEAIFVFMKENATIMQAILGSNGKAAFQQRFKELIIEHLSERFLFGIKPEIMGNLFDYYVAYSVSAQLGLAQLWLEKGMPETPAEMARIATAILFARPGDFYGRSIETELSGEQIKKTFLKLLAQQDQ